MLQPWQTATVIKIEQQTYNTRRFFIQMPDATAFDFKPGQFVTLDLPIHEKPNKRLRSYSLPAGLMEAMYLNCALYYWKAEQVQHIFLMK